jgi:hypothetical protein
MAPRKKVETPKVAISPEPEANEGAKSSAPADVDVFVAEVADADPSAGGGGAPAVAAPSAVAAPVNKPSYATTVVPAPAAASAAPVGSSGQLMGIQLGVETKAQHDARLGARAGTTGDIGWLLGTVA